MNGFVLLQLHMYKGQMDSKACNDLYHAKHVFVLVICPKRIDELLRSIWCMCMNKNEIQESITFWDKSNTCVRIHVRYNTNGNMVCIVWIQIGCSIKRTWRFHFSDILVIHNMDLISASTVSAIIQYTSRHKEMDLPTNTVSISCDAKTLFGCCNHSQTLISLW